MPTLKTRDFAPSKKKINFDHLHNNQINFIPTLSSQVRSATLRSSQFRPSQKNKSTSVFTLKTSNFQSAHKNKVNFDPHTKHSYFGTHAKTNIISISHTKFRPRHWSQVNFDPHSKNKSISHALRHEDQVNFDPASKPSHVRPPHKANPILIPNVNSS